MRRSLVGRLFALGCLVAGLSSCDDDGGSRPCGGSRIGVVHGYVLAAGEAPRTRTVLHLSSADRYSSPQVDIEIEPDSTGWYEMQVPQGTYVLEGRAGWHRWKYTRAGLMGAYTPPDTLSVSSTPLRLDMHLGSASVDLLAPTSLDSSQAVMVRFEPIDARLEPGASEWTSARDGHLRLDAIPLVPGIYRLGLRVTSQEFWLPGTLDPNLAPRLEVDPDVPVQYAGALEEPWHVSGRVLGAWQALGLAPPCVDVFTPDSTRLAFTTAGSDGTYHLALFPQTPVRLLLSGSGDERRWIGGLEFADAGEFSGTPGESVIVPSSVGSGLSCYLEPPDPLVPVRAWVTLVDASGRSAISSDCRVANSNPLVFPFLEPGTYFLRLAPRGSDQAWCAQWLAQTDTFEQALPILVPADGGIARVDMHLSGCGTIAGRVFRLDGSPAGGRRVELFPADEPPEGAESSSLFVVTDETTGEFCFAHVNNGEYRVGVRYTFTTCVWYPGTLSWNEAEILALAGFGEITGLEWSLVE